MPRAMAIGSTRGCPAPKRCTGLEGSRAFFEEIMILNKSLYL